MIKSEDGTVLILRTCNADMTSYGGFVWPTSGPVEAPDWEPTMVCGHGLHGLLWGEGSERYLSALSDAKWLVFRTAASDVMHGDGELTDKCKARRGVVEYCGDRAGAIGYLMANGDGGRQRHSHGGLRRHSHGGLRRGYSNIAVEW